MLPGRRMPLQSPFEVSTIAGMSADANDQATRRRLASSGGLLPLSAVARNNQHAAPCPVLPQCGLRVLQAGLACYVPSGDNNTFRGTALATQTVPSPTEYTRGRRSRRLAPGIDPVEQVRGLEFRCGPSAGRRRAPPVAHRPLQAKYGGPCHAAAHCAS